MNVKKSMPLRRYLSWRMSWLAILTGGVVGVAALLFLALPLAHERAMARLETYAEEISETLRTELTVMARALHLFVERLPGGDYQHGWLPFAAAAQQVTQVFPLVTSVVVGNSSGQGIAWLDLPGMRRIRLTDPLLWESEHRFIELDAALQPQKSYWQALDYDPRQRAWYQRASASIGAVVLTDPYVFYTTRELGVTLTTARKLGEAIEAIGFDVRLTELVQHVHRLAAAQGVRLLLLDGSEQVLAESTSASLWWDRDGKLVRLANLSDPLWQSVPGTGGDWRWAHGQWWQVQALPVEIVGGTRWKLVLAVPISALFQGWERWLIAWLGSLMIGIGLALGLARGWAGQIAAPVEHLAQVATHIGRGRFYVEVTRVSVIREIRFLGVTLERMRRRLQRLFAQIKRQRDTLAKQYEALRAAEARLIYVGLHDPLTDLPNRRLLLESVQQAIAQAAREQQELALLFVDLDRFKELNDTLGHDLGDRLLIEVAQRLRGCVRESDVVARLGGDEFVVMLRGAGYAAAARLAQEILYRLTQPFLLDGHTWELSGSIGIAVYPHDAVDAASLLRAADQAMYWAKESGRNRYETYSPEREERQRELLLLRQDLRVALQQGTVQAWLQPQVWLHDGSLRGAEVLARWQHPQKGWVPPPQFVAVAESHGLIAELTFEMLRQGIAAWKELRSVGIELPCVAVNVSPVVLRDVGFASAALALLGQEGIPPAALELEITETVMLDTTAVQESLHTLEAAGVRLAVDDFGTGYASFGYLNEISFDVLKIDASFVRDLGVLPAADALVQGLVHIGQTLGLELLAEGVETAQQAQRLKEMGVRSAQGYGFGKPMPVGTWPQWWEDYQQVRKAFSA